MSIAERVARYRAIEEYRGRPLIVYATSTRPGLGAMMAGDAVREFVDQIDAIGPGDAVDVLLHSMGGDALAAWKIMSILRERFATVSVLVPAAAFSAATVFALGANEIVMHPHASLGPIDPQITIRLPDGKVRQFAYEDLGAFLGWLREDVSLTEQQHVTSVVDRLFTALDPLMVGAARRASHLAAEVGERMLSMHLADDRKAKQIAVNLNKSFFAHGDAVSRKRATALELQVAAPNAELEKLLWNAYRGLEDDMDLRAPFTPLTTYLADPTAAASLAPVPSIPIPPNTPIHIAQQLWNNVAQQVLQAAQQTAPEVAYAVLLALIESTRVASEFRQTGTISAWRQPGGDIGISVTERSGGWGPVAVPPPP